MYFLFLCSMILDTIIREIVMPFLKTVKDIRLLVEQDDSLYRRQQKYLPWHRNSTEVLQRPGFCRVLKTNTGNDNKLP